MKSAYMYSVPSTDNLKPSAEMPQPLCLDHEHSAALDWSITDHLGHRARQFRLGHEPSIPESLHYFLNSQVHQGAIGMAPYNIIDMNV